MASSNPIIAAVEASPPGKYSRALLQSVVYPDASDPSGTDPFLSFLDGNTIQFLQSLVTSQQHKVVFDEVGDLPKISFAYYKNINLWWVIGMYNGIFDPFLDMTPGMFLNIPSLDSIEAYFQAAQLSNAANSTSGQTTSGQQVVTATGIGSMVSLP